MKKGYNPPPGLRPENPIIPPKVPDKKRTLNVHFHYSHHTNRSIVFSETEEQILPEQLVGRIIKGVHFDDVNDLILELERGTFLTQYQANEILDVLSSAIESEECFKDEVGEKSCFHCRIDKVAGYL